MNREQHNTMHVVSHFSSHVESVTHSLTPPHTTTTICIVGHSLMMTRTITTMMTIKIIHSCGGKETVLKAGKFTTASYDL